MIILLVLIESLKKLEIDYDNTLKENIDEIRVLLNSFGSILDQNEILHKEYV